MCVESLKKRCLERGLEVKIVKKGGNTLFDHEEVVVVHEWEYRGERCRASTWYRWTGFGKMIQRLRYHIKRECDFIDEKHYHGVDELGMLNHA